MDHFPITESAKPGSQPGQLVNPRLKRVAVALGSLGRDQKKREGVDKVVRRTLRKHQLISNVGRRKVGKVGRESYPAFLTLLKFLEYEMEISSD